MKLRSSKFNEVILTCFHDLKPEKREFALIVGDFVGVNLLEKEGFYPLEKASGVCQDVTLRTWGIGESGVWEGVRPILWKIERGVNTGVCDPLWETKKSKSVTQAIHFFKRVVIFYFICKLITINRWKSKKDLCNTKFIYIWIWKNVDKSKWLYVLMIVGIEIIRWVKLITRNQCCKRWKVIRQIQNIPMRLEIQ